VGGEVTLDGAAAARLVDELQPSWAVPMHYRTPAINFFETAEAFIDAVNGEVVGLTRSSFDTSELSPEVERIIVVPAPPLPAAPGPG
jgi:hypothetical protein